ASLECCGVAHAERRAARSCRHPAALRRTRSGAFVPPATGGRQPAAVTNAARDARGPRLLFVGTNRGPGGTESHLVSLAIGMANAGYDVSAVVRPDDVISRALAADGRITLF